MLPNTENDFTTILYQIVYHVYGDKEYKMLKTNVITQKILFYNYHSVKCAKRV